MSHWSVKYMSAGYRQGAEGPDFFDCWTFFRHVQHREFGRHLPEIASPGPFADIMKAIATGIDEQGWRQVEQPETGDGVLLAHLRHPHHIGLYVGDLPLPAVLHCQASGVSLHTFAHLNMGRWRRVGFYRYGAN